ncbi:MAG: hypothetical protein QNJ30_00325 [Kiloniellales bacterium]|nr:hypothetical protein [Kiloniellales bacterium]
MLCRYLFVSALSAVALGATGAAEADSAAQARFFSKEKVSVAAVVDLPALPDGSFAELDGTTVLTRTKTGVGFTFNTTDLAADAPYTVWWVTFNRPRHCLAPYLCGADDFGNPAAEPGVFYATGRVSDAYGQAEFSGEVDYGELPQGEDQVPFPSLDRPIRPGAEVHLIVRAHGPASEDPEVLDAQLTEFNGGCPPYDCVDVQASLHRSPKLRLW